MSRSPIFGVVPAVALALMLSLSACGDGEQNTEDAIDRAVEQAEEQLGSSGEEVDACELLTQEDANELLDGEAVMGSPNTPLALGECVWDLDVVDADGMITSSQEVLLLVQGDVFHFVDPEWEQVDIGDGGGIDVNTAADLISVAWLQDAKSYTLTYFNIGEGMPDVATMIGDMEDLAREISDRA